VTDPLTLFVVFLAAAWLATKFVTGGEGWVALIIAAAVFALVLPNLWYLVVGDATLGLLVVALAVLAAQWLFKTSILESTAVIAATWLAASLLVGGF